MTASSADWIAETVAALPPLVTVKEAMHLLRSSKPTVYRLAAAGRLRAVRASERGSSPMLFPRSELERFLRSLEVVA